MVQEGTLKVDAWTWFESVIVDNFEATSVTRFESVALNHIQSCLRRQLEAKKACVIALTCSSHAID